MCLSFLLKKKKRKETFGQLSILASDSANLHLPLAVEHQVPRLLFTRTQSPLEKWLLSETEQGKIKVSLEHIFLCQQPRKYSKTESRHRQATELEKRLSQIDSIPLKLNRKNITWLLKCAKELKRHLTKEGIQMAYRLGHFSHLTLYEPTGSSPAGSSVHGILQAGRLERFARPSSRGSSWPGIDPTSLTSPALAGGFFTTSATFHIGSPMWMANRHSKEAAHQYVIREMQVKTRCHLLGLVKTQNTDKTKRWQQCRAKWTLTHC